MRYRQVRLRRIINDESAWIADRELHGTDRDRRIMPARKGRLRKNQERLTQLDADLAAAIEKLRLKEAGVLGRMVAAGVVIGS